MVREQIESMDDITAIEDEVRGIVERNWSHLVSKLPPREE
jgi:hypothetical protein